MMRLVQMVAVVRELVNAPDTVRPVCEYESSMEGFRYGIEYEVAGGKRFIGGFLASEMVGDTAVAVAVEDTLYEEMRMAISREFAYHKRLKRLKKWL